MTALENQPASLSSTNFVINLETAVGVFCQWPPTLTSPSVNGGTVVISNDALIYMPPTNFTGLDICHFTALTSNGVPFPGDLQIYVADRLPANNSLALNLAANGANLSYLGNANQTVTVLMSTNLTDWQAITNNLVLPPYGLMQFTYSNANLPMAFFSAEVGGSTGSTGGTASTGSTASSGSTGSTGSSTSTGSGNVNLAPSAQVSVGNWVKASVATGRTVPGTYNHDSMIHSLVKAITSIWETDATNDKSTKVWSPFTNATNATDNGSATLFGHHWEAISSGEFPNAPIIIPASGWLTPPIQFSWWQP